MLFDLARLEKLDAEPSYRGTGEQIDGYFSVDHRHFLLEAKWRGPPVTASEVFAFQGKLRGKLLQRGAIAATKFNLTIRCPRRSKPREEFTGGETLALQYISKEISLADRAMKDKNKIASFHYWMVELVLENLREATQEASRRSWFHGRSPSRGRSSFNLV